MPAHLLVPDLDGLLVGLVGLDVHAGLLTLLAILVQQLEELHHLVVDQVVVQARVELGLVQQGQELVEGDHFLGCEDDAIEQVLAQGHDGGLLA